MISACLLHKIPVPHARVIACCDQVLSIDNANVKAMYRKANAQYINKDFDAAMELFIQTQQYPEGVKGIQSNQLEYTP